MVNEISQLFKMLLSDPDMTEGFREIGLSGRFIKGDLPVLETWLKQSYPRTKLPIEPESFIMAGFALGEVANREFDGHWDFSEVDNQEKNMAVALQQVAIHIPHITEEVLTTYPFRRIKMFLWSENRKKDNIVGWLEAVRELTKGSIDSDAIKSGQWINLPNGGRVRANVIIN